MSFIYLASPYSHPSSQVRHFRMVSAALAAGKLVEKHTVFSPVLHGHHLEMFGLSDVKNHTFWMKQCLDMLSKAKELHVLCVDGWKESKGVAEEIRFANEFGIPVFYIDVS